MAEKFTDDELAFLRHARFGELPELVRPEDYVESAETGAPHAEPITSRPDYPLHSWG